MSNISFIHALICHLVTSDYYQDYDDADNNDRTTHAGVSVAIQKTILATLSITFCEELNMGCKSKK